MSGAHFRIDQAANSVPTGTADIARIDIYQDQPVKLHRTDLATASPQFTLLSGPPGASLSLSGSTTDEATWTSPKAGSYVAELLVGDGLLLNKKRLVIRVRKSSTGLSVDGGICDPAFGEQEGDDNSGGNAQGYATTFANTSRQHVPAVADVATLRGIVASRVTRVRLLYYSSQGDDGGGEFYWDATSTDTDDGGTCFQPTALATGRWRRQDQRLHVNMFGAKPDVVFTTVTIASGQSTFTKSGFTSADIGKAIVIEACGANNAQSHPVPMAGTITNVAGTTITVDFVAVQTATGKAMAYGTDNTTAFQAHYDACITGQEQKIPRCPVGGAYGLTLEFGGSKSMRLVGEGAAATVLMWLSAAGGNLFRTTGGSIYQASIEKLQFQKMPYVDVTFCLVDDPTYFKADQLTFACRTVSQGGCEGNGLHLRNLLTGQVPPRGSVHISDIIHTAETGDRTADGSHGIWIEGNASQGFQQVYFSGGQGNLEQCEWGIRLDYVSNAMVSGTWLIQGNRVNLHIATAGDHVVTEGGITCANAKRATTVTTLRDIILDNGCTNAHFYDPAATPARVQLDDPSYAWFGTETKLTNIPGAILRATPTITGVNGSRYGAGGYASQYVIENTLNDGIASFRVSMMHSSVQRDVYESYWDYNGNFQHHLLLTGGFESWYEGGDDAIPMGNISKAGIQSSKKTSLGDVVARARFDARIDSDEIGIIVTAGTAQAVNLQEWQLNGGGAAASVTKDGYIGASDGTTSVPGFFFQGDINNGMLREGSDACALIGGGNKTFRWNGTQLAFFGVSPVSQQTDIVALTDSTGGTPSNTLVDVGVVFSQSNVNNNFASVLGKINALRSELRALGLMA